jgi:hypothetical protein
MMAPTDLARHFLKLGRPEWRAELHHTPSPDSSRRARRSLRSPRYAAGIT